MGKFIYSFDSLTIQVLAWISEQGMRERLQRQIQAQSWITNRSRHVSKAFRDCLEEALVSLVSDHIYGAILLALARRRLTQANWGDSVAGAIEIDELVTAGHAVFFAETKRESLAYAVPPPSPEDTRIVLAHLAEQGPFAQRLSQLSRDFQGDVCCGAANLRAFFLGYPDILAWSSSVPHFVLSILRTSLADLDWHLVAAQILNMAPASFCQCASLSAEDLAPARVALLQARFVAVGEAMRRAGLDAPEPQRTQALFLADFCSQAGHEGGGGYRPTKEENA